LYHLIVLASAFRLSGPRRNSGREQWKPQYRVFYNSIET